MADHPGNISPEWAKNQGIVNDLLKEAGPLMDKIGVSGKEAAKVIEQIKQGHFASKEILEAPLIKNSALWPSKILLNIE